jgi:DNA invertase Pin-like site-specific DNA recombinase
VSVRNAWKRDDRQIKTKGAKTSKKSARRYFGRKHLFDDPSRIYLYRQVQKLHAEGKGKHTIAKELQIGFSTVRDILRELERDEVIKEIVGDSAIHTVTSDQ